MKGSLQRGGDSFLSSKYLKILTCLSLLLVSTVLLSIFVVHRANAPQPKFFASIDTMKESRDTETHPLSLKEITAIVNLSASLNTNYISVDTHWDYPVYMKQWIDAIRATGRHVWFRIHPNQWENDNGITGIMTPAQYETSEKSFILRHPSFFQPNDILDPCPEPEDGVYWNTTYGTKWTSAAPNKATKEYNVFLRDTTDIADSALHQAGVDGVITTIRSTNSFFATHPNVLEAATVKRFEYITFDSYPEGSTTNPAIATDARLSELKTIENIWHVPVIIGEMGYSNNVPVDDVTQQKVLKAEFHALASLPYLAGINYWVGAGSKVSGGYTYIIVESNGKWVFRLAANALSAFYKTRVVNS